MRCYHGNSGLGYSLEAGQMFSARWTSPQEFVGRVTIAIRLDLLDNNRRMTCRFTLGKI